MKGAEDRVAYMVVGVEEEKVEKNTKFSCQGKGNADGMVGYDEKLLVCQRCPRTQRDACQVDEDQVACPSNATG